MSYAYTTTTHHFDHCDVNSVHRRWPGHPEVAVQLERHEVGGRRGDQITFHVGAEDAKKLCRSLLNVIDYNHPFHKELEELMRVQRTPE